MGRVEGILKIFFAIDSRSLKLRTGSQPCAFEDHFLIFDSSVEVILETTTILFHLKNLIILLKCIIHFPPSNNFILELEYRCFPMHKVLLHANVQTFIELFKKYILYINEPTVNYDIT